MSFSDLNKNHLLASLLEKDRKRLEPHLEDVPLPTGLMLEEPGKPIDQAVFPSSGIVSLVAVAGDDRIEVGIIGREGMTGVSVLLESTPPLHQCFVQVAGAGFQIATGDLRKAVASSPTLHKALLRFAGSMLGQAAGTALANGRFKIGERLARWLLMCQDRLGGDEIPLTQDFLAVMLGVRRPGVTGAIETLAREGLVERGYGRVTILDREGLKLSSRGCYRAEGTV